MLDIGITSDAEKSRRIKFFEQKVEQIENEHRENVAVYESLIGTPIRYKSRVAARA